MFEPSETALTHLCNAVKAVGEWHPILQQFGLADAGGWNDALSMGQPDLVPEEFWCWNGLVGYLEAAKRDNPERLRAFCSHLVSRKQEYVANTEFSQAFAQFEAELVKDGYRFEGSQIVNPSPVPPVLAQLLGSTQFRTGDEHLDRLLNEAVGKFHDPCLDFKRESLEKLWDAWERLKTLHSSDKKASAEKLIGDAVAEPNFRDRISDEARELTRIGNAFMIRHTETDKVPIGAEPQVDYLFHRLFALIWLLLKETGG